MTAILSPSMQSASRKGQIKYAAKRKEKLLDQLKAGTLPKRKVKIRPKDMPARTPLKTNTVRFNSTSPPKRKKVLRRVYKPTGEKKVFLKIWQERGGKCEITGKSLIFPIPGNFMHILSKGAYPKFRLLPENIMLVFSCIHHLYDNGSRAKLLSQFPAASIIYDKKQELKQQYYGNRSRMDRNKIGTNSN